jgi:hypothetical protein
MTSDKRNISIAISQSQSGAKNLTKLRNSISESTAIKYEAARKQF